MRVKKTDLLEFVGQTFGQRVRDLRWERLGGDASDRNYYRVHLMETVPGLPRTLVVMELQASSIEDELPFVNILETLESGGLAVPRFYGAQCDHGLVFLEDLGNEILQDKVRAGQGSCVEALYCEALDMIVKMQRDLAPSAHCIGFRTAFTREKFFWELDFFRTHYIEGLLGKPIRPRDKKIMERFFARLARVMDEEEKVFTHRDFHSRNLIHHEGRLKMLDFQDARMGLAQYDVASLLRDSYVILEDGLRESLLDYYILETERRSKKRIDRSRFFYIFDMTSLQRNLKAIGTFAFQALERHNPRYLKYIPGTLAYVKTNLDRYPELAPYREVLKRYLPLNEAPVSHVEPMAGCGHPPPSRSEEQG